MEYSNFFIGIFETVDSDFLNGYGSGKAAGDIFNEFVTFGDGEADGQGGYHCTGCCDDSINL